MGHSHNLWVDGQRPVELLEFQLPSNKTEQERRILASYTPNMAHHFEPMVEVHSRPTTPSSPGRSTASTSKERLQSNLLEISLNLIENELVLVEIYQ